ncbi:unnamed protein product, partial [Amoebophrya sp. A25]
QDCLFHLQLLNQEDGGSSTSLVGNGDTAVEGVTDADEASSNKVDIVSSTASAVMGQGRKTAGLD